MERSLTVLLPVRNVQSTLAASVREVLDVVSELTEQFDLVIVDDGSEDATSEVAEELTRNYPQVCAFRHGEHLGRDEAIRTGLLQSSGEIVFLRDEDYGPGEDEGPGERGGLTIDGFGRLWNATWEGDFVEGRTAAPSDQTHSDQTWARFSQGHATGRGGYRMFHRRTIEQMHRCSRPTRPNYIARLKDFALKE